MTRGLTLVEVVAALIVLGVGLGVASLALTSLRTPSLAEPSKRLREARTEAIRRGRPVSVRLGAVAVSFAPDGSASTTRSGLDSLHIEIDPLTGAIHVGP